MRYVHRKVIKGKLLKRFILSAVVAGTVWVPAMVTPGVLATDMTFEKFVDDTEKGGTITVTEDYTTVNSEYAGTASYMELREVVGNYDIELAEDSTLTLNNLNMYNTNIVGTNGGYGGNIVINVDKPYDLGDPDTGATGAYGGGLVAGSAANEKTIIKANNLTIVNTTPTSYSNGWKSDGIFIGKNEKGDMDIDLTGKLSITAGYHGIFSEGNTNSVINIAANTVGVNANAWAIILNGSSSVNMHIVNDINIRGGHGISNNSTETMNYESKYGNVNIHADTLYGIAAGTGDVNVKGNNNYITVDENNDNTGYVVRSINGHVKVESTTGDNILTGGNKTTGVYSLTNADAGVELISAQDNRVTAALNGAYSRAGTITIDAARDNIIASGTEALKADGVQSSVKAIADRMNSITAGDTIDVTYDDTTVTFGKDAVAYAINGGYTPISSGVANILAGSVYASGEGSSVDVNGKDGSLVGNYIYSAAVIAKAGGLDEDNDPDSETSFKDKKVISALYAEDGANIVVSGERNEFRSYAADPTDTGTLERTIWAYKGANIEINGSTLVSTDRYDETSASQKNNSADIAIAAGTAVNLTNEQVLANADLKSKVTLNYGAGSSIIGDILSAYAGQVDIQAQDGSDAGISVKGNILAGNNGVLNIDLGKGGYLEGRADDYGDAGLGTVGEDIDQGHADTTFFSPAFSSTIFKGGEVNLKMGEGSKWTVTGQSWVTSVDTGNSEHVEIDLASAKSDLNANVQALTIGEMKGNAMFTMKLDGDRSASDMLYMKKANGEYFINLENAVTVEDMYQDGFDGLRFATVGKGSHATFSAGTYDNGVYNVEYEVGTDDYNGNTENDAYNSTGGYGQMTEAKPGNDLVDNLFKDEPQEAAANGVMTLAAVASPDSTDATEDMGTNTGMNGADLDDTTNFKLIGVKSTELSDAGKTVVAMSKVNYANAIYMDRLNKRMGEARYIDGDEGLWVRIRHDRIGKSDAFRSKNTMMELGYDKRVDDREDGEHRRGFAIDYMRGTTDYHNVAGDGDVRRGGLWLYDTWLGNKGHYSDYVLKIGRLSNDFEVYARSTGEKITGDYSNFVYSASAEYGRKKDIGKDWYFEPQVQLQYAHVTDADYTTSQGTSVELDAIDSLIGRVGFRLGKDMGENNTFYVKADVLHEFLGDQDISAFDDTGRLDTTYENEGTWYDVGLGFSHQFSKGTYMFLDVEKTFGNDNEDTYQFNVGMNWKV